MSAGANKPVQRNPSAIKDALLRWCQMKTSEYRNVNITNFSSSWADGMAFCALIHHFHPDAFEFDKLDPKKRAENLQLAFRTADEKADIMPLLEVPDMLMMGDKPDWKFLLKISKLKEVEEMMQTAPLICLAFVFAVVTLITADQSCNQLLTNENVAESDKVKVQLCQLSAAAKITDDFLSSITSGINEILTDQGVTDDGNDEATELEEVGKRKNDFLRFGKRKNDFLRFGRKNDFLRFGKRKNDFLRFGKRKNDFLRFGKRKHEYLRFG